MVDAVHVIDLSNHAHTITLANGYPNPRDGVPPMTIDDYFRRKRHRGFPIKGQDEQTQYG